VSERLNTASVVFTEIRLGIELGIEKAQHKELGEKESGLFSQPNKRLRKPSVSELGRDFCAFGSMSAPASALAANKSIDKRPTSAPTSELARPSSTSK
jgi:hypothetical protein